MSAGRCAGCGKTDPSCKKIKTHVMSCPDFIELYKQNPEAALDPEAEFTRHKLEQDDTKEERRDTRIAGLRKEGAAKVAVQQGRWVEPSATTFNFE
jgi:hypothetical protein